MPQQVNAGIAKVVDIEEFAARRTATPNHNLVAPLDPRFVEPAQQSRGDMTVFAMKIVARAIDIGRHGGNKIAAVLSAVGLAKLNARDLGHRVPFVSRLKRPGEKRLLGDRLRRLTGINAGRPQKQELLDANATC